MNEKCSDITNSNGQWDELDDSGDGDYIFFPEPEKLALEI